MRQQGSKDAAVLAGCRARVDDWTRAGTPPTSR
jgi:hypothetical protein